jgi:hypothetical protein
MFLIADFVGGTLVDREALAFGHSACSYAASAGETAAFCRGFFRGFGRKESIKAREVRWGCSPNEDEENSSCCASRGALVQAAGPVLFSGIFHTLYPDAISVASTRFFFPR